MDLDLPYECPLCMEHYMTEPYLLEALASVGISRGLSTDEMGKRYFAQYHRNDHRDPDNDPPAG